MLYTDLFLVDNFKAVRGTISQKATTDNRKKYLSKVHRITLEVSVQQTF